MTAKNRRKGAARCGNCGRALAVWILPTGSINPIGSSEGCPCGGTDFDVLE